MKEHEPVENMLMVYEHKINRKLPPIGARIIKSAIAVALCVLIYFFRTLLPIGNGNPFYSALAALWCLQPYSSSTKKNAGQRSIGTLVGAFFGMAFIIVLDAVGLTEPVPVYLLASVLIIPVIYVTVVLDRKNATFFSCVVFLSIALTHSFDENPYLFVLDRVLDTFIGIGIGLAVNNFRLPIKHDNETLYVSGIDDVLIPEDYSAARYSKVELNRLIEAGVKFTVSTTHTPAEVIHLMKGVNLQYPIVAMDGAAMYDIKKNEYIEAEYLSHEVCEIAEEIIKEHGLHCFINTLYDASLLIFYGELKNPAEKDLFETHRHSPYRNYIRKSFRHPDMTERVIYLTVLAEEDRIPLLEKQLRARLDPYVHITVSPSVYKGYQYLKIISPYASKTEMLEKLRKNTGIEKIVTFGSIPGKYDVFIGDGGGNATIKKLKKLYLHNF